MRRFAHLREVRYGAENSGLSSVPTTRAGSGWGSRGRKFPVTFIQLNNCSTTASRVSPACSATSLRMLLSVPVRRASWFGSVMWCSPPFCVVNRRCEPFCRVTAYPNNSRSLANSGPETSRGSRGLMGPESRHARCGGGSLWAPAPRRSDTPPRLECWHAVRPACRPR